MNNINAEEAGVVTPGPEDDNSDSEGGHPDAHSRAQHALRVIEGQHQADNYLSRLREHQADPDELALIVATLAGAALAGFCRRLEKAVCP
jgi:hypothetical protein